jgi:hypothetical protein
MMNDEHVPACLDATEICFGMDRETDERSLKTFLRIFSSQPLLDALVPRLSESEITSVLDFLSKIMHTHFSEKEYHSLFLNK